MMCRTCFTWHYLADDLDPTKFDVSSVQKPKKFVAVLSHNYTPEALKSGLHALKGRDRVLGNLLVRRCSLTLG